MPDDARTSRRHLNRQGYAERFARGDSYGLLLALLIAPLPPHRRRGAPEPLGTLHHQRGARSRVAPRVPHVARALARVPRRHRARRDRRPRQLHPGGVRTTRRRRLDLHHVRAGAAGADRDRPPDPPARDGRARDDPRRRSACTCSSPSRSPASTAAINEAEPHRLLRPADRAEQRRLPLLLVRHHHHRRVRRPHRGHEHRARARDVRGASSARSSSSRWWRAS